MHLWVAEKSPLIGKRNSERVYGVLDLNGGRVRKNHVSRSRRQDEVLWPLAVILDVRNHALRRGEFGKRGRVLDLSRHSLHDVPLRHVKGCFLFGPTFQKFAFGRRGLRRRNGRAGR